MRELPGSDQSLKQKAIKVNQNNLVSGTNTPRSIVSEELLAIHKEKRLSKRYFSCAIWLIDNILLPWGKDNGLNLNHYCLDILNEFSIQYLEKKFDNETSLMFLNGEYSKFHDILTKIYSEYDISNVKMNYRIEGRVLDSILVIINNLLNSYIFFSVSTPFQLVRDRTLSFLEYINKAKQCLPGINLDLPLDSILEELFDRFSFSLTVLLISYIEKFINNDWKLTQNLRENNIVEFINGERGRTVQIFPKNNGVSFGCIIHDWEYDKNNRNSLETKKTYYIKSHRFYRYGKPIRIAELNNNSPSSYKYGKHSMCYLKNQKRKIIEHINIIELLVYELLNRVGIAPKVHFMTIKSLPNGIFIVTEKVDPLPYYSDMRILEANTDTLNKMIINDEFFVQMNIINIVSKIFFLSDMNSGNYGVIYDLIDDHYDIKGMKIFDFWIDSIIENHFEEQLHNPNIGDIDYVNLLFDNQNTTLQSQLKPTLNSNQRYQIRSDLFEEDYLIKASKQAFMILIDNIISRSEYDNHLNLKSAPNFECIHFSLVGEANMIRAFDCFSKIISQSKELVINLIKDYSFVHSTQIHYHATVHDVDYGPKIMDFYCESVMKVFALLYNYFFPNK